MSAKIYELLNAAGVSVGVSTRSELECAIGLIQDCQEMTSAEIACLCALRNEGPLFDGDLPSKTGMVELLDKRYAVKIVCNGEEGYNACTYKGGTAMRVFDAIKAAREKQQ
jgi:hypothetical protein